MSRSPEALHRRMNAHIARETAGTCLCKRCVEGRRGAKAITADAIRGAFHNAIVRPGVMVAGSLMGAAEYASGSLDRLAEFCAPAGATGRGGNASTALRKRQDTARIAGAVANILDTELKRQHSDHRSNYVTRHQTTTGSEVIQLTVDGVAYNLTLTRART